MLATAESCTGGWIAKTITDIPGCSAWFDCGMAAYSYEAKQALLGVRPETLTDHGAVSRETGDGNGVGCLGHVRAPASPWRSPASPARAAARRTSRWAPSGSAGSGAAATRKAELFHFDGDREAVRRQTVEASLQGLLKLAV